MFWYSLYYSPMPYLCPHHHLWYLVHCQNLLTELVQNEQALLSQTKGRMRILMNPTEWGYWWIQQNKDTDESNKMRILMNPTEWGYWWIQQKGNWRETKLKFEGKRLTSWHITECFNYVVEQSKMRKKSWQEIERENCGKMERNGNLHKTEKMLGEK